MLALRISYWNGTRLPSAGALDDGTPLVANGPAWHDRFPGLEFTGIDPDAFAAKERVADYFVDYAKKISAPVRCGVEVTGVERNVGQPGFRVETSEGLIVANSVVAATGPFQNPNIPPIVPASAGIKQIHSSEYRNPLQLPEGAVLVVGAGSSGVQIAEEISRARKQVYLSVGPSRAPTEVLPDAGTSAGGWVF